MGFRWQSGVCDSTDKNRPSGSETIYPEALITAQKAPVTIPADNIRKHAPHAFYPCPECKLSIHKNQSTCPFIIWYRRGKARVEWQHKTENNLTRRHRNDGSTETDTAASMRVWPSVRHKYIEFAPPPVRLPTKRVIADAEVLRSSSTLGANVVADVEPAAEPVPRLDNMVRGCACVCVRPRVLNALVRPN